MRSSIRSPILVLLILSTGCKTTGGKVFGTAGVASGIGSMYLLATSSTSIEHGRVVAQEDRANAGVGLMFAAVAAACGWFFSEASAAKTPAVGGGGGGWSAPAEPAIEPAPAPAAEPAPAPAAEPAPPAVIVVRDRGRDERVPFRPGWRLDPQDGQDKLYGRDGELIGRINPAGYVWNSSGTPIGRVDMTSSCDVACKHSQARKMLLGSDGSQEAPPLRSDLVAPSMRRE